MSIRVVLVEFARSHPELAKTPGMSARVIEQIIPGSKGTGPEQNAHSQSILNEFYLKREARAVRSERIAAPRKYSQPVDLAVAYNRTLSRTYIVDHLGEVR